MHVDFTTASTTAVTSIMINNIKVNSFTKSIFKMEQCFEVARWSKSLKFLYWLSLYVHYRKNYWHFFTRAAEHMSISHSMEKCVKNVEESIIFDQPFQCGCLIDFNHFNILAFDTNKVRQLLKESLLIKCDKPVLNHTIKWFPLETIRLIECLVFFIIIIRGLIILISWCNWQ